MTFKEGDVTALRSADVGSNFNLLLDMECFNWLSDSHRPLMAREVDEVAAPDATLLLLVWARAPCLGERIDKAWSRRSLDGGSPMSIRLRVCCLDR